MKKKTFYAVAGATTMLLFGCQDTVMQKRNYVPAPESDPNIVGQYPEGNVPETTPAPVPVTQPNAEFQRQTPPPTEFAPMTDVKSSGGVDHAPRHKRGKGHKAARQSEPVALPPGGVYKVRPGDFPERIARKFKVSVAAFLEANHLDQNSARKLQVGQTVKIPNVPAVKGRRSGKKGNGAIAEGATVAVGAGSTYLVRPGDNPYIIAKKFRIKRSDLLKANNLTIASAKRLKVGQKLIIPGGKAKVAVAKNRSQAIVPPPVAAPPIEPERIAPKVEPAAPIAPPAVDNNETVETVGKNQIVEVTEETISAADFAAKHGMSVEEFQKLNPGKGATLSRGNVVFVTSSGASL